MMNTVFTMDHRFGDAALGIKFLNIIKSYVEDPENFKLENFPDAIPYHILEKQNKQNWSLSWLTNFDLKIINFKPVNNYKNT